MSNRPNISLQTLGFVSNTAKRIKPLGKDAHLLDLGMVTGSQVVIKTNASVYDTLELMQSVIAQDAPLVKKLAESLRGATLEATCNNVWRWVYQHIEYQLDTQFTEQVRKPLRCIKEAIGDCDCMSTLVGALLQALGIKFYIRMTAYSGAWQHVYIVVPKNQNKPSTAKRSDYYTMDCVLDAFDSEKRFSKKHDVFMELAILGSLGNPQAARSTRLTPQQVRELTQIAFRLQRTKPLVSQKLRQFLALSTSNPEQAKAVWLDIEVLTASEPLGKTIFQKAISVVTAPVKAVATVVATPIKTVVNVVKNATDGDSSTTTKSAVVNTFQDTKNKLIETAGDSAIGLLARNGYLFMLQENFKQQAVKLGWALMPKAEFLKYSDDGDYWERSLASLRKVESMFIKMGGDVNSLHKNIKQGFNQGRKHGKIDNRIPELSGVLSSYYGLGDPTAAALISAGTAMFATAAALIDKKMDNNFAIKTASIQIEQQKANASTQAPTSTSYDAPQSEQAKSNTGLYVAIGLGVLALGTGIVIATRPKKTKSSLSGTVGKITKTKSKSKPKSTKPKAKSIKAKSNKKASTAQKSTIKKQIIKF